MQVKRLQKHQAFQAEVSAHQGRLSEIQQAGETLIAKRHEASREIHQQLESSQNRWKRLLAASNLLGRGLEEAQDILDFNTQVEKAEAWIRDKELMIQQGDLGRDYEHCQVFTPILYYFSTFNNAKQWLTIQNFTAIQNNP